MAKSSETLNDAEKENSTPNIANVEVVEAPLMNDPTEPIATKEIVIKKRRTLSQKAGLVMPVLKIHRDFRKILANKKLHKTASVYATAIIEYVTGEVLDMSGDCCLANKRKRIIPRHIKLAVDQDEELKQLFSSAIIFEGGVVPFIHSALLPLRSSVSVLDKTMDRSGDPEGTEEQELNKNPA